MSKIKITKAELIQMIKENLSEVDKKNNPKQKSFTENDLRKMVRESIQNIDEMENLIDDDFIQEDIDFDSPLGVPDTGYDYAEHPVVQTVAINIGDTVRWIDKENGNEYIGVLVDTLGSIGKVKLNKPERIVKQGAGGGTIIKKFKYDPLNWMERID
jgi:hypothetical protein